MKTNRAFKYRFYPTPTQVEMLAKTFGCVRVVYNQLLDWRNKEYTLNGNKINYTKTSAKLTELKQNERFAWLNEVSSVALQQCLRNQDKAFSNFFAKRAKYPNFKRKNNNQSFQLMANAFKFKENNLYIAKSDEPLDITWSRPLDGVPSSITISKDCANRYFVSFCCESEIETVPITDKTIGIDLGLTAFAVTSDGEKYISPKVTLKHQKRLAKRQRKLSRIIEQNKLRQIKHSKRQDKARIKVAKVHNKIKDSRKDFLHKLSTKLINENQVISIEDLNVSGMIRNRKLAKHIADASWSEFVRQLEYKASWYGRTIVKVSAWYPSSQICSNCGDRGSKKALDIRKWECHVCNTHHDRDVNASKNIHTAGLAEL